ncbi:MAG: asparagine synthase (glutamine-hydrolyzing) [Candidatus Omnitrophica bacterium]|nr:asparagine synthase (glutamine-hydrolyzing) [Candidatus Omnitrophota bacterium]MDD5591901.1 asparagine synthase (glutamine-hydrolyzing) [Candidatus Omnitrophota bacterium]
MCGICGILDYRGTAIKKDLLLSMCRAMPHRGPDDEGIYIDIPVSGPCVGLGHRRLKIIDLSQAGHQPMPNEDKTVWIVFNGEVYNFKELRAELIEKGHVFQSNTDTECVIHLYEEYGEDCVSYLRGMFAFAIWDRKSQILILARDRVGKKPVLYYHKDNKFCFASEFCALLAGDAIDREINPETIDYYLTLGYIPAPLTIYKDIFKLPAAHILVLKNNALTIKKYWELNYKDKIKISEQEAAEEVLRLLKEAVSIRLYSDVPLGAFLSGGIDSSTVVALMSQLSANKIKTFSIGFQESNYDELKYARNIAERFDTEHREFIVKPEALRIIPLLVERYGEPYADSSCIPTYYVSQQTRQYVTVALNGDGGDELFAGYERYQAMLAAERIPKMAKKIISGFSAALPDSVNFKSKARRFKRFLTGAVLPAQLRYIKWIGIFDDSLKKNVYSENFMGLTSQTDVLSFIKPFLDTSCGMSTIDSLLLTDTVTYLPYDLLVKVDITSMANSLEARSPFLDQRLMEFVARLPAEYKMKNFVKKYILKKAVKDLVPRENIHRKKMGFGVPVGEWFREELKDFTYETLLSTAASRRGYFKTIAIKNIIDQHISRQKDYTFHLWSLLMLELWHRRFIDK